MTSWTSSWPTGRRRNPSAARGGRYESMRHSLGRQDIAAISTRGEDTMNATTVRAYAELDQATPGAP